MTVKTYYELLEVASDAPGDEIKKAFRRLIAKYHPDKVHHLGAEFQDLALERASALTAAYKTLIDPDQRAEYDRLLVSQPAPAQRPAPPPQSDPAHVSTPRGESPPPDQPVTETPPQTSAAPPPRSDAAKSRERGPAPDASLQGDRDAVLKRAVLSRMDRALLAVCPAADRTRSAPFDLSYFSKPRLLGGSRPWLLAKFVPRLDARIMQDVWTQAVRAAVTKHVSVAVFVLTGEAAPEREIADVIAGNRRRPEAANRITVVPVDVRDWRVWIPTDADRTVRSVAERLRAAG